MEPKILRGFTVKKKKKVQTKNLQSNQPQSPAAMKSAIRLLKYVQSIKFVGGPHPVPSMS